MKRAKPTLTLGNEQDQQRRADHHGIYRGRTHANWFKKKKDQILQEPIYSTKYSSFLVV